MSSLREAASVARWIERDRRWALALHRHVARPWILALFAVASRLGDGVLWYGLVGVLMVFGGMRGVTCALVLVGLGTINLLIYRWLKRRFARPRPFDSSADFRACARALDPFSFPSGHSLHAVAFAVVMSYHYPQWWAVIWSVAALITMSRVVLGLHYPSDVLVGGVIGAVTASLAVGLLRT